MRKVAVIQKILGNIKFLFLYTVLVFGAYASSFYIFQGKSYSATCGSTECSSQGKYNCQSDTMCCTGNGCPSWDCADAGTGCFWVGDEFGSGQCQRQCAASFRCYNNSLGELCGNTALCNLPSNACRWTCLDGWVKPGQGVGNTFTCNWGLDSSSTCSYCSGGCTAVNGVWGGWSACSTTCGTGTQTRLCDNPAASCGGAACSGNSTQSCTDTSGCPVSNPPTLNIVPPNVDYSGQSLYPLKVVAADADPNGSLKISTSLSPPNNGWLSMVPAIEFRAYGTSGDGIWPIARLYGWNKNTGNREAIHDFLINSSTPTSYWWDIPWPAYESYTFYDLEFTNDYYGGPGKDVNLYVDNFSYLADNMWYQLLYRFEAEDPNFVQYDRGDPDDGYDLISPSTITDSTSGSTHAVMAWGGTLRFPVVWQSPATRMSGLVNLTVTDELATSASKSVPTAPVTGVINGKVWLTDNPPVCNGPHDNSFTGGGLMTANAGPESFSAPLNGSGQFSITQIFGSTNPLCLSGLPATPAYRISCINDEPVQINTDLCAYFFDPPIPGVGTTSVDIGIRPVTATSWLAAYGNDLYAKDVNLSVPIFTECVGSVWGDDYYDICPDFTETNPARAVDHYALLYNPLWPFPPPTGSSVFTEEDLISVGPSIDELSESGVSATDVGSKFREKNEKYFASLRSLIEVLKTKYSVILPTYFYNNVSLPKNSIWVLNSSYSSIPATASYNITEGLAFLLIPKGSGPITINKITTYGEGRLVILADRDIVIGSGVNGEYGSYLYTSPTIQASIVTTGNITVSNYPLAASSSVGAIIIEGPLVVGGNTGITLNRSLGDDNEFRPAFYARYNPLYVTKLNDLAAKNTIPALNPLFTFDFTVRTE